MFCHGCPPLFFQYLSLLKGKQGLMHVQKCRPRLAYAVRTCLSWGPMRNFRYHWTLLISMPYDKQIDDSLLNILSASKIQLYLVCNKIRYTFLAITF